MSKLNWNKVETIIDKVLDLPEDKRKTFIEKECGDDLQLKNEVVSLLESIDDSEGWLENPHTYKNELFDDLSGDIERLSTRDDLIGSKVGSYTIKEKIGEGGMGTVFLAQRSDGEFKHQVAIKIIRHSRATKENIQRFKREQHILAKLNHPGIAHLYDGGVTKEGFPYIIMEYVDGSPITEFCQKHNFTVDQKITVFKQVLEAVRNAHENLTIHRDLKPDNILIDKSGNVKILDFGISKLLGDDEDEGSSLTKTGSKLLTPRYAAPEQIKQESITTATDLYSLGIVLYQLLTNADPIDLDNLTQYQVEQAILKEEPEKPSENVSDPKLKKKLKGDLDAIVLKSIRKEPGSRYRVANDFLNDLYNFYAGIPVSAREDSLNYRTQKFLKRHKQGIAIATGVFFIIIGLTGFYTSRITKERNQAQLEAQKATEVTEFLVELFNQSNPYFEDIESVLDQDIGAILSYGSERINEELEGQPKIQAELKTVIGSVYRSLGEFSKAETLLTDALEMRRNLSDVSPLETGETMRGLAFIAQELGEIGKAESLLTETIYFLENSEAGLYSEPAVSAMNRLGNLQWYNKGNYDKADSLLHKSLAIRKQIHSGDHLHISHNLNDLAALYHAQGQYSKAKPYYQQSIEMQRNLISEHPNMAILMSNFSSLLREEGNLEESEKILREALAMHRRFTDEESIDIALGIGNLGHLQFLKGNYAEADSLLNLSKVKLTNIYGNQHPYISRTSLNIGRLNLRQGKLAEAEQILTKVNEEFQQVYPPDHPRNSDPLLALGQLHLQKNNHTKAKDYFEQAHQIRLKGYPKESWRVAQTMSAYGFSLSKLGQFQKADSLLVNGYKKLEQVLGSEHEYTSVVYSWLTEHYNNWGKPFPFENAKKQSINSQS